MPDVLCLICNSSFYVKPNIQAKGWGKYCSIKCRNKSQFNGKNVSCFICNKHVYRTAKDIRNSQSGKFFCNKTCQTIWRNTILFAGENHSNWKFGTSAYRRILESTDREKICTLCKTTDTRILVVHHLDKNRKNNKLSNLIWLCHNCHYLVHHYKDVYNTLTKVLVAVVQK